MKKNGRKIKKHQKKIYKGVEKGGPKFQDGSQVSS